MIFGDIFRSMFGMPNRPADPNNDANSGSDEFDPVFGSRIRSHDGGFSGSFPGGSFFFGTWPPPGSHPEKGADSQNPGGFGRPPLFPFDPSDQDGPGSSDAGDLFRHFDEMFRSFGDVFRSMGMADFPAFGHGSPSIEAPPAGEGQKRSPRDSMLKEPDSSNRHHDNPPPHEPPVGPGRRDFSNQEDPESTTPASRPPSTPFDWFFAPPQQSPSTMPQNPLDSDLDDEVRNGDLMQILQPQKPRPFSGVRIMEPRKQQPEGFFKSVQVHTFRRADGKVEERRTIEDGLGNRETTVTRSVGDQSHSVTTRRKGDQVGEEEVIQHYQNMDENDKRDFDERWRQPPNLGTSDSSHNRTDTIFDLFRKGFPGFPSKG